VRWAKYEVIKEDDTIALTFAGLVESAKHVQPDVVGRRMWLRDPYRRIYVLPIFYADAQAVAGEYEEHSVETYLPGEMSLLDDHLNISKLYYESARSHLVWGSSLHISRRPAVLV